MREERRAHADYRRWRFEFLANADPMEAQNFLIEEQTNALIKAQSDNTALLGAPNYLSGTSLGSRD